MDCRKSLGLALGLLVGLSGCRSWNGPSDPSGTHSSHITPRPPATSPYQALGKDATRQPSPALSVAAGDYFAKSAAAPDRPPQDREQSYEQARLAYLQALKLDPNYLPAQLGLARCHVEIGELDKALAAYQRALEIAPQNGVVWHDMAQAHLRRKDWSTALSCLERAMAIDPANRAFQTTYGWALARSGRQDEALACFTRLSNPAQAHYKLARMLHHMQQTDAARGHLQAALREDPQCEEAKALLAQFNAPANPVTPRVVAEDPSLPPRVEPIRAVIYQQPAAPPAVPAPTSATPKPLDPAVIAPTTTERTLPPIAEPVLLLPKPPTIR